MPDFVDRSLRPQRPDVIDEAFEGESVLVHLRTGCYFSLNKSATAIWGLLQDGRSVQSVAQSHGAAAGDVSAFVEQLIANELVEDADADAGVAETTGTYDEPPALQRFTDMQDLLMLDPIHDLDLDGDGWPVASAQAS
jgi:hypothetical protein